MSNQDPFTSTTTRGLSAPRQRLQALHVPAWTSDENHLLHEPSRFRRLGIVNCAGDPGLSALPNLDVFGAELIDDSRQDLTRALTLGARIAILVSQRIRRTFRSNGRQSGPPWTRRLS